MFTKDVVAQCDVLAGDKEMQIALVGASVREMSCEVGCV